MALPRRPAEAARLGRLAGRGWALVPLGSIVGVIFAIRFLSDTATGLTWLALVAVPPLTAVTLAWAARRPLASGPALAITGGLFALAWALPHTLAGEGAAALLSGLSCVTLGVLLAAVTPPAWLKVGIVLMATADAWLVVGDLLQAPNATLAAAAPPAGLPRLQTLTFGSVQVGYGDLFIAAVLGAVLALEGRDGRGAALLVFAVAAVFDLLFLVVAELPATVPVALALLLLEGRRRWRRRQPPLSGRWRPSRRPAAATPRRAT